jgi:hypothetical protein
MKPQSQNISLSKYSAVVGSRTIVPTLRTGKIKRLEIVNPDMPFRSIKDYRKFSERVINGTRYRSVPRMTAA